ncbi:hypothetical protein AQUCO_11000005v1 [Aquilegia coerulea]|uniref:DNA (cytosine-5-)-methyltransferase n=1 Tax=Aquilegia coerulea TaxID=218851 RepID=A0A2G5C2T0_AQUCA|nr:hypothetical protein AQUCO_11000005v1 [Aquilegia coerulea]
MAKKRSRNSDIAADTEPLSSKKTISKHTAKKMDKQSARSSDIATAPLSSRKRVSKLTENIAKQSSSSNDDIATGSLSLKKRVSKPTEKMVKQSSRSNDIATAPLSSKKRVSKPTVEKMGNGPSSSNDIVVKSSPLKKRVYQPRRKMCKSPICSDDITATPSSSKKKVPGANEKSKRSRSNNIVAQNPSPKRTKVEPTIPIDFDPEDDFLGDSYSDHEEEVIQDNAYTLVKPNKKPTKLKDEKCSKPKHHLTNSKIVLSIPFPLTEAKQRWPHRYRKDGKDDVELAKSHFKEAKVNGIVFNLDDDAYVKAKDGDPDFIAKIVELFESTDKQLCFTAQWYYRIVDTVIGVEFVAKHKDLFDARRVFYSDIKDVNPLDCLISKLKIQRVSSSIELSEVADCDFYCDMSYAVPYSTFSSLPTGEMQMSTSTVSHVRSCDGESSEMSLLDLYSGCGAMSTGLCLGAAMSNVNLVTRWALDLNPHACESLKFNHPEANVRNESADDYLFLLKTWTELCNKYCLCPDLNSIEDEGDADEGSEEGCDESGDVFEVEKLLEICYGDPNKSGEKDIYFKVRWKGFDESEDTWEPIEGMSTCPKRLKEFVIEGYKSKLLPLPGQVHVVCGGPPCQGVSGFNRFRNYDEPLADPRNKQLITFMDIVEHLKPNYVLMENVTDILKFVDGYLGKYAIGRLVSLKYQTRLGLMVAGCYGLPQYRMRAFFWGALPCETLPQFPLPTHRVIGRGSSPRDFEDNVVAHANGQTCKLEPALCLKDALSDLPEVMNGERQDVRAYEVDAKTDFQKEIRKPKSVALDESMLFDHFPYKLNVDDYQRVCKIPQKKGANYRNLPWVLVDKNNIAYLDPKKERLRLPSKKPLVPNYALKFVNGKSTKPFRRLWWDEIVSTVVTRPEPHNQAILHPEQDRVLTIRENARLQGFYDDYKLFGPEKERYIQVGNAVAVPVARALGFALGLACRKVSDDQPLVSLPIKSVIEDTNSEVLE